MRELTQIIDELHTINQQIVEKDIAIDHMRGVIDLISEMMTDAALIQSDNYLDLRAKYLTQIEAHLTKIKQVAITIEPETIFTAKKSDTNPLSKNARQFTIGMVNAPIHTDIYQAPSARKVYTHKKERKTKKTDPSQPHPTDHVYVSFDFHNQLYYLQIDGTDPYSIYNQQDGMEMSLVGQLTGSTVTILNPSGDSHETIQLKSLSLSDQSRLFGSYILDGVQD